MRIDSFGGPDDVSANWTDLLRQSWYEIGHCGEEAFKTLSKIQERERDEGRDFKFDGTAVALLARMGVEDYRSTAISVAAQKQAKAMHEIADSLHKIGEALETRH